MLKIISVCCLALVVPATARSRSECNKRLDVATKLRLDSDALQDIIVPKERFQQLKQDFGLMRNKIQQFPEALNNQEVVQILAVALAPIDPNDFDSAGEKLFARKVNDLAKLYENASNLFIDCHEYSGTSSMLKKKYLANMSIAKTFKQLMKSAKK